MQMIVQLAGSILALRCPPQPQRLPSRGCGCGRRYSINDSHNWATLVRVALDGASGRYLPIQPLAYNVLHTSLRLLPAEIVMHERPSLQALAVYLAVVEHGTMTAAAEAEGISQPAISAHVKALERFFGTPLMARSGRRVTPTAAGDLVADYSRRILGLVDNLERSITALEDLQSGKLIIGASSTVGEQLLPEVLGVFSRLYPGIDLVLSIGNSGEIIQAVRDRTFDLGIVVRVADDAELVSRAVFDDHLEIIVAPDNPYVGRTGQHVADLSSETFIFRESGSATRDLALHCLAARGCAPGRTIELGSNEAVKRAVSVGLGVGVLSAHTIAVDKRAGMLGVVKCVDWDCRRNFWLIHLRDRLLTRAEHAFLQLL